jgi:catechol 2,3-dioxygenase-like lactoylglutathione lyase family enzyme
MQLSPIVPLSLDHVGLSVLDLERCRSFYQDAFGFQPEHAFTLDPHPIRGLMMRHESGARLELFADAGSVAGLRASTPIEALATRGYGHFAVSAPDIEPVFEQAIAAGASSVLTPRPSPEPGVRFAFLADPEGNLVELVERR